MTSYFFKLSNLFLGFCSTVFVSVSDHQHKKINKNSDALDTNMNFFYRILMNPRIEKFICVQFYFLNIKLLN